MATAMQFNNDTDYSSHYPMLSSNLVTTHCETAEGFLNTLLEISPRGKYIFRGQNFSFLPVIATLFRPEFIAKEAIDSWFTDQDESRNRGEFYDRYFEWEEIIVRGFANNCMNEGIPLPHIPYNEPLSFDTEAVSAYFVARNYGIPNRLLDFTRSPIIGAWFAAYGVKHVFSCEHSENAVVWAIHHTILSEIGYAIVSTLWANAQIPQMQRQKAVLLADTKGRGNFVETGQFQPMEYMIEHFVQNHADWFDTITPIMRITLPQGKCFDLLRALEKYELSEVHLFPTFDTVAKITLSDYSRHANAMAGLNNVQLGRMKHDWLPFIQT